MDYLKPLEVYLESKLYPKKERTSHHPSSLSIQWEDRVVGACNKRTAYEWLGYEETNKATAIDAFRFEMGHWFEDAYEEGLKTLGLEYRREVPIKIDWGLKYLISGRVDFIVKNGDNWEGVELKSSYGRNMDYIKKKGLPKEDHMLQMMAYMDAEYEGIGKITAFNNPYIARDSFYRMSFRVEQVDCGLEVNGQKIPFTKEKVIERLKILESYIEKKALPPRDFNDKDKYPCAAGTYVCPYWKECWK